MLDGGARCDIYHPAASAPPRQLQPAPGRVGDGRSVAQDSAAGPRDARAADVARRAGSGGSNRWALKRSRPAHAPAYRMQQFQRRVALVGDGDDAPARQSASELEQHLAPSLPTVCTAPARVAPGRQVRGQQR